MIDVEKISSVNLGCKIRELEDKIREDRSLMYSIKDITIGDKITTEFYNEFVDEERDFHMMKNLPIHNHHVISHFYKLIEQKLYSKGKNPYCIHEPVWKEFSDLIKFDENFTPRSLILECKFMTCIAQHISKLITYDDSDHELNKMITSFYGNTDWGIVRDDLTSEERNIRTKECEITRGIYLFLKEVYKFDSDQLEDAVMRDEFYEYTTQLGKALGLDYEHFSMIIKQSVELFKISSLYSNKYEQMYSEMAKIERECLKVAAYRVKEKLSDKKYYDSIEEKEL